MANTMKGMPGPIKTGLGTSSAGLASSPGVGPKKEGPIGKRGSSGPFPSTARGTMSKNALGHKGRMESLRGRAKTSYEK